MAQSGYTPILIYASGTASNVPLAADMTSSANGAELALNYNDGKLYYKNSAGVVTMLAGSSVLPTGITVDGTNPVGYLNVPQNAQTGNYTLVLGDAGKQIYHAVAAGVATYTIPANASVAFPIGTAVTFINMSVNNVTIAITSDTMYLAGLGTTGSRTLAQYGMASAVKMTSTTWIINGAGLT
jgi:hypothetical protein